MIEGLRQIADNAQLREIKETLTILNNVNQCDENWDIAIEDFAMYVLKNKLFDQLAQLVIQGPVDDGDVISKRDRDTLVEAGLAVRVTYQGQFGFTSATYRGGFVMKTCFVSDDAYRAYIKSKL